MSDAATLLATIRQLYCALGPETKGRNSNRHTPRYLALAAQIAELSARYRAIEGGRSDMFYRPTAPPTRSRSPHTA